MMANIVPRTGSVILNSADGGLVYHNMNIELDQESWAKLKKYIERFDGDTFGSLAEAIVRGINILDAQRSMDEYGDKVDKA